MSKKVGIMTLYYKTYNFGAQLQAYALQKAITALGYEAEVIRFKWYISQLEQHYKKVSASNYDKFEDFSKSIPHSKLVYTPENIYECSDNYDIFVCGSDQIWGVTNSMPIHVIPQITLSFVKDSKVKLAYAASMGGSAVSNRIKDAIAFSAKRLDAISVRETSAVPFVAEMAGKAVSAVLDPTMLLDTTQWDEIAVPPKDDSEYIFVYNIGGNAYLNKSAEKLSKELNCEIKTLSYSPTDSEGPAEFVGLIKYAKFVLTNSFHGTVFSILYGKQFLSFCVDNSHSEYSKNIRLLDLLNTFNIGERFINGEGGDLGILYDNSKADSINEILKQRRKESLSFLTNNLCIEKKADSFIVNEKCSGCGACLQKCPNGCITMLESDNGITYPVVDSSNCTDCGLCKQVCHIWNKIPASEEAPCYYATYNLDDTIRDTSSSDGMFMALAEKIISEGGVVYGAKWSDNFAGVEHNYAETIDGCKAFQLSKYVQSDTKDTFISAERFLKSGRKVLYTGCPCQINALRLFLGKDYENLYLVDLICIGVAAKGLWRKSIEHYASLGAIDNINHRNKSRKFSDLNDYASHCEINGKTIGMQEEFYLSLQDNFYKDCCFDCEHKGRNRFSEITIGDFWGYKETTGKIESAKNDSLVIVRTLKGRELFEAVSDKLSFFSVEPEKVENISSVKNPMLTKSWRKPPQADYLRSIFSSSSIDRLFYENKLIVSEISKEYVYKDLFIEINRNELYCRLLKFQSLGLSLDYNPLLTGKVIIYGSGKVGRLASECFDNKMICFVDRSDMADSYFGYRIFRMTDVELSKIVKEHEQITFLITPIQDFDNIEAEILDLFPNVNIISIEKSVEKIWL